ncbi:DUF3853 family protein [Epilithonimonas ginsengisoli]|uniref:DUF3853 family protein n=1 Tax=Epilithonimonas ginsengisoli TaxID=1245592 RepID=A0ABU4JIP4_9FLAO|nr:MULTISPECIES: DUF3853 family protein [Chryseobacterium group]MBV6879106.1 DUF3853 family protein [Epilithonimonas sp. FP105]MDW8549540.1 DUF3853 family protein [Epilithonimonas ginsengisoli]OAH74402.1 hypothetical protein AXA65_06490 [Chryseobacterium sp. FP211-J200]
MEITHNNLPEALALLLQEVRDLRQQVSQLEPPKQKEEFYGIAGIAKILNCCNTTAQRIKNTGYIDGALYQAGRQILIDKDKLQQLYKENEHKIKSKIRKSLAK